MGYECIKECQIEVAPGKFKYIITGQTEHCLGSPINYVKPISRKYFRLTGEDVKKDVQDKVRIKKALDERHCHYPKGASTSDLAKILAKDNASRGIANFESLKIDAAPSHFADRRIIDAKSRIDELYDVSPRDNHRPYKDDDNIDTLLKMIEDKESDIIGDPRSEDNERSGYIAELKSKGIPHHHNLGTSKLKQLVKENADK